MAEFRYETPERFYIDGYSIEDSDDEECVHVVEEAAERPCKRGRDGVSGDTDSRSRQASKKPRTSPKANVIQGLEQVPPNTVDLQRAGTTEGGYLSIRSRLDWDPRVSFVRGTARCNVCRVDLDSVVEGNDHRGTPNIHPWLRHCGTTKHQKKEDEAVGKGELPPKKYLPARFNTKSQSVMNRRNGQVGDNRNPDHYPNPLPNLTEICPSLIARDSPNYPPPSTGSIDMRPGQHPGADVVLKEGAGHGAPTSSFHKSGAAGGNLVAKEVESSMCTPAIGPPGQPFPAPATTTAPVQPPNVLGGIHGWDSAWAAPGSTAPVPYGVLQGAHIHPVAPQALVQPQFLGVAHPAYAAPFRPVFWVPSHPSQTPAQMPFHSNLYPIIPAVRLGNPGGVAQRPRRLQASASGTTVPASNANLSARRPYTGSLRRTESTSSIASTCTTVTVASDVTEGAGYTSRSLGPSDSRESIDSVSIGDRSEHTEGKSA